MFFYLFRNLLETQLTPSKAQATDLATDLKDVIREINKLEDAGGKPDHSGSFHLLPQRASKCADIAQDQKFSNLEAVLKRT